MRRSASLLALAASFAAAAPASAATIEVKTISRNASPSVCTLWRAIQNANRDDNWNPGCDEGTGADTIRFDVDTDGKTIVIDEPLPEITGTLTIRGRGVEKTTISGGGQHRVFTLAEGATLVLESLTIEAGAAPAGNGGALLLLEGSTAILRECRIAGSEAANGGGVYVNEATLRIERCLIEGNAAAAQGGGILSRGGSVEIVNTTLSGNDADEGGGIAVVDAGSPGVTELYSVTLADNGADAGGNVLVANDSELWLRHTLLAQDAGGGNCDGPVTSLDHNLSDDASCDLAGDHDRENVAAGLAALASNGGPTRTHALQPGSAAIDAGAASCSDGQGAVLETDQRGAGFPRRTNGDGLPGVYCDIGAFEQLPEPAAAGGAAAAAALAGLARRRRARVP